MMRNLLRFDLAVGSQLTTVGLNMDEISSITDVVGSDNASVRMTNGDEWVVVGSAVSIMDLVAGITDDQEGRSL